MKLPFKLVLFRIMNYLHAGAGLGILCVLAYEVDSSSFDTSMDVILFLLFVTGFLACIANAGINLLLLERHYPATMPAESLWRWGNILFVAAIIILTILTFLATRFYYYNPNHALDYRYHLTDFLTLIFTGILLLSAIPVLWLQVAVRKTIRSNYHRTMDNFLNTDTKQHENPD